MNKVVIRNAVCYQCGLLKPISDFIKDSSHKNGFKRRCRTCTKNNNAKYYKERNKRDNLRRYLKKKFSLLTLPTKVIDSLPIPRHKKELAKLKPRRHGYKKSIHSDFLKCTTCKQIKHKSYFYKDRTNTSRNGLSSRCRDCSNRINKIYVKENKSHINKKRRERYKRNSEKILDKMKLKRKSDKQYALRKDITKRIHKLLKNRNGRKGGSFFQSIGYSIEELRHHLEKLFKPEMTWENHGTYWHIDHIIPDSFFEYTSMNDLEFKLCWRLENLQPLEAYLNLQKSNKLNAPKI